MSGFFRSESRLHDLTVDGFDLFFAPNLRTRIEGVRFCECVFDHAREIFFFDELRTVFRSDLGGNVHCRIEIFDPLDERFRLAGCAFALDADDVCELCEFLLCGFAVRFEDIRKDDCVRKTVRHAVFTAEGVCYRVYVTDVCTSEGFACEVRRVLHIVTCGEVLGFVVCEFEVFADEFDCIDCVLLGLRGVFSADIRFDRVSQCVHTRGGGDVRRKTDGKFGVHNDVSRNEERIVDGVLLVSFGIGDNRRKGCFGTGTGSGRNRNEGCGEFLHYLDESFHLRNGLVGFRYSCADDLRAVHCGTAAECDDDVTVVLFEHFETVFDIADGRIGNDFVENARVHTFRLAGFEDGGVHAEVVKTAVGDDEDALVVLGFQELGEFFDGTGARKSLFVLIPRDEPHKAPRRFLEHSATKLVKRINAHTNCLLILRK